MKEPLLQVPAEITKVTTMSNDSLRLQVDTQENVTPVAQAMIFGFKGKPGVFAFAKSKVVEEDLIIPDFKPSEEDTISPSQRLRNIIYRVWEKRGKVDRFKNKCDFEIFYRQEMTHISEEYKKVLE